MFWGEGVFVFPLMLLYTFISYRVFRRKAELYLDITDAD
jgi:cytochrome d ubiquinol oxidase subunit II